MPDVALTLANCHDRPAALAAAGVLVREYIAELGVDLSYQHVDEELGDLAGHYAPPDGALIVAALDGVPAGCVAVRRFDEGVAELKRMYVRPAARGHGVGRALLIAAIGAARGCGYRRIVLDSLPSMAVARRLYEKAGFVAIAPYYATPIVGTAFYALDLAGA